MNKEKCTCCSCEDSNNKDILIGKYVCYCNNITEEDIKDAITQGAQTVQEVIQKTGAMKNSNCAVNNPKGTCCYSDIVYVFNKYKKSI